MPQPQVYEDKFRERVNAETHARSFHDDHMLSIISGFLTAIRISDVVLLLHAIGLELDEGPH